MVFTATLKLLSPLLSPLFLPLHCPPAPLSSFLPFFCLPPPPTKTLSPTGLKHLLQASLSLSLSLLCYHPLLLLLLLLISLSSSLPSPPLTSFLFQSFCRNITENQNNLPYILMRASVCVRGLSPLHLWAFTVCSKLHQNRDPALWPKVNIDFLQNQQDEGQRESQTEREKERKRCQCVL